MAVVSGRLQIRDWTDNNGNKRRNAEVVAENVYFGDSKSNTDNTQQQTLTPNDFEELNGNDDDLPF